MWLARPARVTPGAVKLVFHVIELLLEIGNFFFLRGNFVVLLVNFLACELFVHGLLWVRVILQIGFFSFALQDAKCFFRIGNFLSLSRKALAPGGFGVGIFLFFFLAVFGDGGCAFCDAVVGLIGIGRNIGGCRDIGRRLGRDIIIGEHFFRLRRYFFLLASLASGVGDRIASARLVLLGKRDGRS